MTSNFVVWTYRTVPHACTLNKVSGFEDKFKLRLGEPLLESFPTDVAFHMDPDFPTDLGLPDNVLNVQLSDVVSPRLHAFLARRPLPSVEFLPIRIVDHKNRVASDAFVVVHPLDPVDCIDRAASVYEESFIIDGDIDAMSKLVIDETRVPADRVLFKLAGFSDITLVRRDLAAEIDKHGFSGLGWVELAAYPEP